MTKPTRAILRLIGADTIHFLQGILTQDVAKLAEQKIQFTAMLSPQGKILHDMFLVADGDAILIDTAAAYKDVLLKRLNMYKLRAKVEISDVSDAWSVAVGGVAGLADPRHADLPKRNYLHQPSAASETTSLALALGIPELGVDFEPDSITAMDAGYDLLNAISFTKGCYVGQEVTARMHYKNIARRGFYMLEQAGIPKRLALLKFDEVESSDGHVTVENESYSVRLPSWMQPKLDLFRRGHENQ